jgi:acyl carrier protein phosphodiesterase
MEQIFVYRTLKKPEVQKSAFEKIAESFQDILQNYARSEIKLEIIYPMIVAKNGRFIKGFGFFQ